MQATDKLGLHWSENSKVLPEEYHRAGLLLPAWTGCPLVRGAPQLVEILCGEAVEFTRTIGRENRGQLEAPRVLVIFQENLLMLREVQVQQREAQLPHSSDLLPEIHHIVPT